MKLFLVFMAYCIGVSWTVKRYPNLPWPSGSASSTGSYFVLVNPADVEATGDLEEDSIEQRMTSELQRLRGSNFPALQQYHHNENVNQYYGLPLTSPPAYTHPESHYGSVNSRQKNGFRLSMSNLIGGSTNDPSPAQQRLFYPGFFFPSALYTMLSDFSTHLYSTTTTYFQLNTTLTTTMVKSCIPLNQFASANSMFFTNSCRRKRDEDAMLAGLLVGDDLHDSIGPFQDENDTPAELGIPAEEVFHQLESSKETETKLSDEHLPFFLRSRYGRAARYTVTISFTNYSFYTVNSTRTVQLYSGANTLTCMPYGFYVC